MQPDYNNTNIATTVEQYGFSLHNTAYLKSLDIHAYELHHKEFGCRWLHLSNADDNNCFASTFLTCPQDSTGVAHILEHTVLCGSEKFPTRDPFFSMIRRSLKSFMNAFTASDWTMYPFATRNKKDFSNLLDVYLDAAFFPRLERLSFLQEGHRFELDSSQEQLAIHGVVYNEMKGAMSTQRALMMEAMRRALFPSTTYGKNSGGDPEHIPELTWEALKAFHAKHYHPDNAVFYTYGTFPLEEHLKVVKKKVLDRFSPEGISIATPNETRYQSPQVYRATYPLEEQELDGKNHQFALCWLTENIAQRSECLALELLESVLLGSAGSPLRKALLESKLGKSLSDVCGLESDIRELPFCVGLQGVAEEDIPRVHALIYETLEQIATEGIAAERIESELHQIELSIREITGGSEPYGLSLILSGIGPWIHGIEPISALDFDAQLAELKAACADEDYFPRLIRTYLLENPHCSQVILAPDTAYQKAKDQQVQAMLQQRLASMSEVEKNAIAADAQALQEFQESSDPAVEVLPTLELADIQPEDHLIGPYLQEVNSSCHTRYYAQPTNRLIYVQCNFNLPVLCDDEYMRLPLLGTFLVSAGCSSLSYDALLLLIRQHTGGISAYHKVSHDPDSSDRFDSCFSIGGKALLRNTNQLLALLQQVVQEISFHDTDRIVTLIKQKYEALKNSVVGSGHSYALKRIKQNLTPSGYIDELTSGISQVGYLRRLVEMDQSALSAEIALMQELGEKIFALGSPEMVVVGEQDALDDSHAAVQQLCRFFADRAPAGQAQLPRLQTLPAFTPRQQNECRILASAVAYVVHTVPGPRFAAADAPAVEVMCTLLKAQYLHTQIREQGGAYGAMAHYDSSDGSISFLSYRDPHIDRTIEVYQKSRDWLLEEGNFSQTHVKEAILESFSRMDTPLSPAGKAYRAYHTERSGRDIAQINAFRSALLAITKAQVIECAQKWLQARPSLSVIAGESAAKASVLLGEKGFRVEHFMENL